MVWIRTVPEAEATVTLAQAYRRQAATLGHPSDFSLLGSLDPNLVAARLELQRASERCPSMLTQSPAPTTCCAWARCSPTTSPARP